MAYSEYFNKDDCRILLKKIKPELEFKCYSMEPFNDELRGYLGEHLLLTIKTSDQQKMSFFVKSTQTTSMSECHKDSKYFEREVLIYKFTERVKRALPHVRIDSIPKYIHSNQHEMLVLENLSTQGYTDGGFHFTQAELEKAIEALAKFHVITLAYEEHNRLKLGRVFELPEECGEFQDPIFKRNKESSMYKSVKASELGVHTLIDLFFKDDKVTAADFKNKFSQYLTKMYKLLNEKNSYRKVISHGDLWGNNMVFKYDENGVPIDCKLVDFQYIRYAPPANDLIMLIYFTSDTKQYQNVNYFCNHYYNSLKAELENINFNINTILPLDEFTETCRLHAPCAKIVFALQRQISHARYLSLQKVSEDMNLYKSVLLDTKRAWFVTENYHNDTRYREFLKTLIYNAYDVVTKENFPVEDCYKVIHNTIDQDYTFLDYNIKPLSEKGGFLGEHAILKIRINTKEELTLTYFLKQPPILQSQKNFAIDTGALFKEKQFYARLIPDFLSKHINGLLEVSPKCYNADDYSLVLNDQRALGFSCIDKQKSMDLMQVNLVLKTLSRLHASGLIYEERTGVKLNKIYGKEFLETFYQTTEVSVDLLEAAKKGIEMQIKIFPDNTEPKEFFSQMCKLVDAFRVLTTPSNKYRNTICHGDLWINNIFLSNEKSVLVDFQSYRYCPPAHDVMQFIYLSTNRKFRDEYLDNVLDYYHEQLAEILVDNGCDPNTILPHATFMESCRFEKTMAVVQAVTHFHNILMSNERMESVFADAAYCKTILFVDRSDNIKETCSVDPLYRQRNHEAITDARELCKELVGTNFDFDRIIRI